MTVEPETLEAPAEQPVQPVALEPKRVAIVGYTMSNRKAPWGADGWEIWACNNLPQLIPDAWHRLYDLHPLEEIASDEKHAAFLAGETVDRMDGEGKVALGDRPLYTFYPQETWPTAVAFPKDEVVAAFGDYFTNSISWMVAHALLEMVQAGEAFAEAKLAELSLVAQDAAYHEMVAPGLRVALRAEFLAQCELHVYGVDMSTGCLAPDTKVLLSDLRWVNISQVHEGHHVIAFDEEPVTIGGKSRRRRWRSAMVTQRDDFTTECYRVGLEDGTSVVASAEHRWLVYAEHGRKWKRTDELITPHHRPGRPTRIVKPLEVWESDKDRAEGYLAGVLDGEGWLSQGNGPTRHANTHGLSMGFAQRDNAVAELAVPAMADRGFDFSRRAQGGGSDDPCYQYELRGGRPEIMRCLGTIRPERLLRQLDPNLLGEMRSGKYVAVTSLEYLGERPVIGLRTETGTILADGLASHNSEYAAQRPSVEFHLGIATALGVRVHIPIESDLLKTIGMYGTLDTLPFAAKLQERRAELMERGQQIQEFDERRDKERRAEQIRIAHQRGQIMGALETVDYIVDVWGHPRANRDGTPKDLGCTGAAASNGHGSPEDVEAVERALEEVA